MVLFFFLVVLPAVLLSLLTLPGTITLLLLTLGALKTPRRFTTPTTQLNRLAVIIPAHNESANIADCVHSLQHCEKPRCAWQLYVIADNCSDDTAAQAHQAGATVWERQDDQLRGKGYALDYAFNRLLAESTPPDALLIVDADTAVAANFLTETEHAFAAGADGVQCRYTVRQPEQSLRTRLMNVAFMAFNVLRPRARQNAGLSVGIAGNGWGVSADTVRNVPYTARSVVEDLEYHIALVRAGRRIQFLDQSYVLGDMPSGGSGAETQRARWEGGRFRMMREHIPGLLQQILQGHWRVLEPLLELLLLPLALHVLLLLPLLLLPFGLTQAYALLALGVVIFHVLVGIWVGGGTVQDVAALASAPFYILWKLTLLPRLFKTASKKAEWVRTERDSKEPKS